MEKMSILERLFTHYPIEKEILEQLKDPLSQRQYLLQQMLMNLIARLTFTAALVLLILKLPEYFD